MTCTFLYKGRVGYGVYKGLSESRARSVELNGAARFMKSYEV